MSFLLADPEVGKLLRDAVDPNKGFAPLTFQSKLFQTKWWKKRSQSQREWEILKNTDPGTFRQSRKQYTGALTREAGRLGVRMTNAQKKWLTAVGMSQGLDPNDPQQLYALSQLRKPGKPQAGAIQTAQRRVQAISRGEYLHRLDSKTAGKWGDWIARGIKTEDDWRAHMRSVAVMKFPWLKDRWAAGETPGEVFSGHVQTIADELEIAPQSIDLTRGKWKRVTEPITSSVDKEPRMMNLQEVTTLARSENEWWRTSAGKQADATLATTLAQAFGRRR